MNQQAKKKKSCLRAALLVAIIPRRSNANYGDSFYSTLDSEPGTKARNFAGAIWSCKLILKQAEKSWFDGHSSCRQPLDQFQTAYLLFTREIQPTALKKMLRSDQGWMAAARKTFPSYFLHICYYSIHILTCAVENTAF